MTKTISVEYVGPKHEYVDPDFGTGTWTPGMKKDVPAEVAPYMLFHHDVWKDARSAVARKKEPITPSQKPITYRFEQLDKQIPLANLAMMDKATLAKYAESTFQHRFDYDQTTAQQMRSRIVGLMRERA
jgi:hypothetical protein